MPRFKPGQEITPNTKKFNVIFGEMGQHLLPKFGEIYHVRGYPLPGLYSEFLSLEEFPERSVYHEDRFEPVVSNDKLHDALSEVDHDLKVIKQLADG